MLSSGVRPAGSQPCSPAWSSKARTWWTTSSTRLQVITRLMPLPYGQPASQPALRRTAGLDGPALEELRLACLTWVLRQTVGHIWQHAPFALHTGPPPWRSSRARAVPPCLWGSVPFGDNVEDEWLVCWLLLRLTGCAAGGTTHACTQPCPPCAQRCAGPHLVTRRTSAQLSGAGACREHPVTAAVWDNDGSFLLIEAALALPKWLKPELADNRVWLSGGRLHIIPLPSQQQPGSPAALGKAAALQQVQDPGVPTLAGAPLRSGLARAARLPVRPCLVPCQVAGRVRYSPDMREGGPALCPAAGARCPHCRDRCCLHGRVTPISPALCNTVVTGPLTEGVHSGPPTLACVGLRGPECEAQSSLPLSVRSSTQRCTEQARWESCSRVGSTCGHHLSLLHEGGRPAAVQPAGLTPRAARPQQALSARVCSPAVPTPAAAALACITRHSRTWCHARPMRSAHLCSPAVPTPAAAGTASSSWTATAACSARCPATRAISSTSSPWSCPKSTAAVASRRLRFARLRLEKRHNYVRKVQGTSPPLRHAGRPGCGQAAVVERLGSTIQLRLYWSASTRQARQVLLLTQRSCAHATRASMLCSLLPVVQPHAAMARQTADLS